ncbi:hypothetical protein O3M35_002556 [Rhynocoris fuscipes]|uniref:NADH dehydrogenase subunit 5 n=1 Tax=Rhynocoris fuscipes TaxID=488301 RepID=A0AAW1CN95_9HEMI
MLVKRSFAFASLAFTSLKIEECPKPVRPLRKTSRGTTEYLASNQAFLASALLVPFSLLTSLRRNMIKSKLWFMLHPLIMVTSLILYNFLAIP